MKPVFKEHTLGTQQHGLCSQLVFNCRVINAEYGKLKVWLLKTGNRFSNVVFSTGLTVHVYLTLRNFTTSGQLFKTSATFDNIETNGENAHECF